MENPSHTPITGSISTPSLEEHAALLRRIEELEALLAESHRQLDWFRRQLFGMKSEGRPATVVEDSSNRQVFLGEWAASPEAESAATTTTTVAGHERKKRGAKSRGPTVVTVEGLRFGPETPLVEVVLPEGDETRDIPEDRKEYLAPEVTHRLCQHKSAYFVERSVRPVVKVKAEVPALYTAPLPPTVFAGSCASPSFLAGMLVDKYQFHQPLYRVHKRLLSVGIVLSRATLTSLEHKLGALLSPIADEIHRCALTRDVMIMDETPRLVWVKENGKMVKQYMWMLRTEYEVFFAMGPGRAHGVVYALLGIIKRTLILVTDGYEAYECYAKDTRVTIIHACCHAHARRKFIDAQTQDKKLAAIALDRYYQPLYRIEKEIREKELVGDEKKAYRQTHSKPLMDEFKVWLTDTQKELSLLPKSPITGACSYLLERWEKFTVFLDYPEVPIDTNEGEREMRPHALGRNNWKVNMSEDGSEHVCTFYSIIQSCLLAGVDPYDYLLDVLPKIHSSPHNTYAELTPLSWKKAHVPNST